MSTDVKFNEGDLADEFSDAEEYTERERYLVRKFKEGKARPKDNDDVLGFGSDDDEDIQDDDSIERFENDSDLASDRDDGIPDAKAWGKTKSAFYNTNYVDQDYSLLSVREEEKALLEEQEARYIQMQLSKHLKEVDFALDAFIESQELPDIKRAATIPNFKTELSGLTLKQKQQLLKKSLPEFSGLVDELNVKIEESYNELEPIIEELMSKNIPEAHPICNFIRLKNQLHLTYVTNITFYLLIKASQKSIKNHPILKRLVQLKELLGKVDEKYEEHIRPEVERLLELYQSGKKVTFGSQPTAQQKKKLIVVQQIVADSDLFVPFGKDAFDEDNYDDDEGGRQIKQKMEILLQKVREKEHVDEMDAEADEEDDGEGNKRKITYQMAKNKGLTPHRKKEQRNPRVKHRQKFRKALVRRKGAIRTIRTETSRYRGEYSGIKSTVRKGIKIK